MPSAPLPLLIEYLSELPDPRIEHTRLLPLLDILTLGICAVICGAQGWEDRVLFGRSREAAWFRDKILSFAPQWYSFCRYFILEKLESLTLDFRDEGG